MRRPVVGLSLAFASGVWAGLRYVDRVEWIPAALVAGSSIWLLAAMFLACRRQRSAVSCLYLLSCVLGMVVAIGSGRPGKGLATVPGLENGRTACTLEGVIHQDVIDVMDSSGRDRLRFGLRCDAVTVAGVRHEVVQPVSVTLFGTLRRSPVYGERWGFEGTLFDRTTRPSGRYGEWTFHAGAGRARCIEKASRSLATFSQRLRRRAAAILAHGIEDRTDATGVINALLLGYRTRLPPPIRRSFANTGTMHIFAISGLHVAILGSVLVFAIGMLRVPRTGWVFALAPVILLYAVTTGSRASAIRAGIMATAYLLAPALRRRADAISALALAGILILVWQPAQLMETGFVFSFTAVTGILAIVPLFESVWQRCLGHDPLAAPVLADEEGRWWRLPALYGGRLAAVSLAAWLTSLPLSMYYFGRFAPIALAANLLVMPLAFLIIVTGCLSLATGVCIGLWPAGVFNAANGVFIGLLTGGMRHLEAVPFGYSEGWRISRFAVMLWYLLLGMAVLCGREQRRGTIPPEIDS